MSSMGMKSKDKVRVIASCFKLLLLPFVILALLFSGRKK